MKRNLQLCFAMAFLPLLAISQTVNFSGTVYEGNSVVAYVQVSIVVPTTPIAPPDTIAITYTDGVGNYEFELSQNQMVDSAYVVSEACPGLYEPFVFSTVDGQVVDIYCNAGSGNEPVLYIGGVPMDEASTQWYFMSNFSAIAETYLWEIEGVTYTTPEVTHVFQSQGYHDVYLTVATSSGESYSANTYVMVGSNVYCSALFFPMVDSIADNVLYFVNSSVGENLEYLWDFGDGTTSTDPYPTHTFGDQDSIYYVCLTVYNTLCADSICMQVGTLVDPSGSGIIGYNGHHTQSGLAKSGTFEFVVGAPQGVLSTSNTAFNLEINLFPNPTTGDVNLQIDMPFQDNGRVVVTDLSGKIVLERNLSAGGTLGMIKMDVSRLADGIYLVQYQGKSNSGVQKMVLQR